MDTMYRMNLHLFDGAAAGASGGDAGSAGSNAGFANQGERQPEKVVFFKLEDGSEFLDIPPATELTQIVTVNELK